MFYKILRAILRPILFLLYRPKVVGLNNFPMTGQLFFILIIYLC